MPEIQRTFVMIKPDGVQRALVGEIIGRFEARGLKLIGMKMLSVGEQLAEEHYRDHKGKPFFAPTIAFVRSGPVVALALEGPEAVPCVRQMMGALDPREATPGSIRGDFASERQMNLVHGSDSAQSAARELALWFRDDELVSYSRALDAWVISS